MKHGQPSPDTKFAGILISDLPPELWQINLLSHPGYSISIIAVHTNKNSYLLYVYIVLEIIYLFIKDYSITWWPKQQTFIYLIIYMDQK